MGVVFRATKLTSTLLKYPRLPLDVNGHSRSYVNDHFIINIDFMMKLNRFGLPWTALDYGVVPGTGIEPVWPVRAEGF